MKLSVELTLYPLQDNYLPVIDAVLEKLNSFDEITVKTFPSATIFEGEYDQAMLVLSETVKWSYENYGKGVFVAKFLTGYAALTSPDDH